MKRNRKYVEAAMVAAGLLLLFAAPVLAQGGTADRDRVSEALVKTDEIIAQARETIGDSRSEKARLSLDVAIQYQGRARGEYDRGRYVGAMKLTLDARDAAWRAISLARADVQTMSRVGRLIEETEERIARVRLLMLESGVRDEQSRRLIDEALNLVGKARLSDQELRYQVALKLATNARQLATNAEGRILAIRRVKEGNERKLALLERLLERMRERLRGGSDERSLRELAAIEAQLTKARELGAAGRYREMQRALERAEKMLRTAARLAPGGGLPPGGGAPASFIEDAYRLLRRAEEMLAERGGEPAPAVKQLIAAARETIERAERSADEGRADEARTLAAQAREMLRKALAAEGAQPPGGGLPPAGGLPPGAAEREIAGAEGMRGEALNLASACGAPGIKMLIERAEHHLARAREALSSGDADTAAAEAAIARNLFRRVSEICATE